MFSFVISLGFFVFFRFKFNATLISCLPSVCSNGCHYGNISRDIRTVSGIWTIELDGSWVFIPNTHNAVKKGQYSRREKVAVVRELLRESYGSEYVGREHHMSYQWTDWMGTPPIPIKTDEVADLSLLLSLVNVEELISGEENSNTSTLDEPTCKFPCLIKVLSNFHLIFYKVDVFYFRLLY